MRCPSCDAECSEGSALCESCGAPLTPYAATVPLDADPARTAARLARETERPVAVWFAAAADVGAALFSVLMAVRALTTAPALSPDATNYLSHAFGGLLAIVVAALLIPLGGGFAALCWGTLTQRGWAWSIHAGLIAVLGVGALLSLAGSPVRAILELVILAALARAWLNPTVRRWYGHT